MMAWKVWATFVGIFILCLVIAGLVAEESNAGFATSAAVLTFVGAVAVAVERLIEMLWTAAGSTKLGGWWPLKDVREAFDQVEEQTNELLNPLLDNTVAALQQTKAALQQAGQSVDDVDATLERLEREGERLNARLANARTLAPGSARLELVSDVTRGGAVALQRASMVAGTAGASVRSQIDQVDDAAEMALDIVGSFQDNPARRVASLLLGMSLGLLIAGLMGLNLFTAIFTGEEATAAVLNGEAANAGRDPLVGLLAGLPGVLLTGVIVGLGASPTHEAIKSLQRYKERQNPGHALLGTDGTDDASGRQLFITGAHVAAVDDSGSLRRRTLRIRSTQ